MSDRSYLKAKREPRFLGVPCNGPNIKHSDKLREEARCLLLLADFYALDKSDQLIMAAMVEQMIENNN